MDSIEQRDKQFRVIGYIRVSRASQNPTKNRADILEYANAKRIGPVNFVEETVSGRVTWTDRLLYESVSGMRQGDYLIIPELSRLGRSMLEIMEILNYCMTHGIRVHAIKGGWELGDTVQSKVLAMAFSIAAEIERDLISARTKEALRARKAEGVRLGRPPGPGKSRLDEHRSAIEDLLANGATIRYVARRFSVSPSTLHAYLRQRSIDAETLRRRRLRELSDTSI